MEFSDLRTIFFIVGGLAVLTMLCWIALMVMAKRLKPGLLRDLLRFLPACVTTARRLRGQPIPTKAKVALVLAIVWLVSPLDPVPDIIPIIGTLDDILVAVAALRYTAKSIDRNALMAAWPESEALLRRLLGKD